MPRSKNFNFIEHIVGKYSHTIRRRNLYGAPPPLDATDHQLIDNIRRTGKIGCGGQWDELGSPYSANGPGEGMRAAEERSRKAQRANSAWFNDEMLQYWKEKWRRDDRVAAKINKEIEADRARWRDEYETRRAEEAQAMREHTAWVEEEAKKRAKAELLRRGIEWVRIQDMYGKVPYPKKGFVIYWNGYVVVHKSSADRFVAHLKDELIEKAHGDGLVLYWPTIEALNMIWPPRKKRK